MTMKAVHKVADICEMNVKLQFVQDVLLHSMDLAFIASQTRDLHKLDKSRSQGLFKLGRDHETSYSNEIEVTF